MAGNGTNVHPIDGQRKTHPVAAAVAAALMLWAGSAVLGVAVRIFLEIAGA